MTERQLKKYRKKTEYNAEKRNKADNFTFLNQTVCCDGQTVLAGDSITELFNMELFDEWSEKTGGYVYNRGISGDTSDRLLERFKNNVLSIKPKTVVLLIGINDLTAKAPPEYIAENTAKMHKMLRAEPYDIHIILQAVYPVNPNMYYNLKRHGIGPEIILNLNRLLKKQAEIFNADFLDLTQELSGSDGFIKREYTYDGLHPNARCFAVIAQRLQRLMDI